MGNQCAGLKEKAQFECIERKERKPRMSDSILDSEIRLSEYQIDKISEYHERFMKNSNPAAKLFDKETHKKIIDKDKG